MLLNIERARDQMQREGFDALIAATTLNVAYAGDFASEFSLGHFEDHVAAVVLARDPDIAPVLVVPEFDLPYLTEQPSWIENIRVYGNPWSSVGTFMGETLEAHLSTPLRRRLKALRDKLRPAQQATFFDALDKAVRDGGLGAARLGCDDPRAAARLALRGIGGDNPIRDARQTFRRIRMVKTAPELAILTRGAALNAAALAAVIAEGKSGMAEADVIRVYRRELTRNDARYLGERGMMFGVADAGAFSLPASDARLLQTGDVMVLDCLGTYRGYHMDLARTGVVGAASPDQRHRHKAVQTTLEAIEAAIRPGSHTQALRDLARRSIAGLGLRPELVSVTTHGLGLEVFEFPEPDSLAAGFALEAGMVVNTEVFYRDPDLGSFHLEDSVLVEKNGCRFLHPMPRDLVVFR